MLALTRRRNVRCRAKNRKSQAATEPDSEPTSYLGRDSLAAWTLQAQRARRRKTSSSGTTPDWSHSQPEDDSAEKLNTGWSEKVTRFEPQFLQDHIGNIPDYINNQSTALSFLKLFLITDFWRLLCSHRNLTAEQIKQSKPASYYTKNFKPAAVCQIKASLSFRLQMEKCVIKPRYESYQAAV